MRLWPKINADRKRNTRRVYVRNIGRIGGAKVRQRAYNINVLDMAAAARPSAANTVNENIGQICHNGGLAAQGLARLANSITPF